MKKTSFSIMNDTGDELEIIHEPECFTWELANQKEVEIVTGANYSSVLMKIAVVDGKVIIAILDDKSHYTVLQNGEDVFRKYFD